MGGEDGECRYGTSRIAITMLIETMYCLWLDWMRKQPPPVSTVWTKYMVLLPPIGGTALPSAPKGGNCCERNLTDKRRNNTSDLTEQPAPVTLPPLSGSELRSRTLGKGGACRQIALWPRTWKVMRLGGISPGRNPRYGVRTRKEK